MTTSKRAAAVAGLVLAGLALGAAPAAASQGSVPAVVAAYAADPNGLLATLEDLAGPGSDGAGIDFTGTTTVGQLNRIFTFTPAWLAGDSTDTPVERQNQWTAPIAVDSTPVGVAVIWINPQTDRAELADFSSDPGLTTAVTDVPADAYLVHDESREAWFTLIPPDLTALSGGEASATLDEYQAVVTADAEAGATGDDGTSLGALWAMVTVALVSLVVIAAAFRSFIRAGRRESAASPLPTPEGD